MRKMFSSHFLSGLRVALGKSKIYNIVYRDERFEILIRVYRFAYDSMKIIIARTLWNFDMSLTVKSSEDYSKDQLSYVSFHQPPLLVSLVAKEN